MRIQNALGEKLNFPKQKKRIDSPADSELSATKTTFSGSELTVQNIVPITRASKRTAEKSVALLLSNAAPTYQARSGSTKSARQNHKTNDSKYTGLPSPCHRV